MVSVKELRDMIRKHREAECPKITKMKKADLMKYAEEKGLLKNAPVKEVKAVKEMKAIKEKKPRENKVVHVAPSPAASHAGSMSKKEMTDLIKKIAVEHIKKHPDDLSSDGDVSVPKPKHGSEANAKLAHEIMYELHEKPTNDEKQERLRAVMIEVAGKLSYEFKNMADNEKRAKSHANENVKEIKDKIEKLQKKLNKAKSFEERIRINDEMDSLKRLLPRETKGLSKEKIRSDYERDTGVKLTHDQLLELGLL